MQRKKTTTRNFNIVLDKFCSFPNSKEQYGMNYMVCIVLPPFLRN